MARLYPDPEHQSFRLGDSSKRALLIHGFPGTPWEVRHIGEFLAELGWEVYAPLLPGFGPDIESLGDYTWNDWARTALRAYEELREEADTTALIGFSMGSALAVHLAAEAEVQRLALVNPFSGLGFPLGLILPAVLPLKRSYHPFWRADFDDPWTRNVLRRVLPDLDVDDLTLRERIRREVRIPVRAVGEVQKIGSSAWRLAPSVASPTLIVQGTADRVVPPARTRRFASRLGGSVQLKEVPGGHPLVWPGMPGHEELISELRRLFANGGRGRTSSATRLPQRPAGHPPP